MWKVWTRPEKNGPPDEGANQLDSKDAALERAYDIIRHEWLVKVLYIEGPDGSRIEAPDIEMRFKERAYRD